MWAIVLGGVLVLAVLVLSLDAYSGSALISKLTMRAA
jgi:hypothetical protein